MTKITIREVANKRELHTFLTFPWKIYKGDPLWVPPILADRYKLVDPKRGVFFQRGWDTFAWRDETGRYNLSAIDYKANAAVDKKTAYSVFWFINDCEVALHLNFVREWQRRMN
jgi:hypothetical protein